MLVMKRNQSSSTRDREPVMRELVEPLIAMKVLKDDDVFESPQEIHEEPDHDGLHDDDEEEEEDTADIDEEEETEDLDDVEEEETEDLDDTENLEVVEEETEEEAVD